MKDVVQVGVVGAAGRMGQRLCQLLTQTEGYALTAVLKHRRPVPLPPGCEHAVHTSDVDAFVAAVDVVIDFSAPAGFASILPSCRRRAVPYVLASTALSPEGQAALAAAGTYTAVLHSPNLSVGVYVLGHLLQTAIAALPDFTLELLETHHRHKRDAPSGTLLSLFAQAQQARPSLQAGPGLYAADELKRSDQVGLHAMRGGDVAGEHHAMLFGDGERLELVHRSHDGLLFARGALRAASWLVQQPPGLYSMADMLALPKAGLPAEP